MNTVYTCEIILRLFLAFDGGSEEDKRVSKEIVKYNPTIRRSLKKSALVTTVKRNRAAESFSKKTGPYKSRNQSRSFPSHFHIARRKK